MSRVTVVGAGHVGLTAAVGLASLGHKLFLVESDRERVAALRDGTVPLLEPGLEGPLRRALSEGSLTVGSPSDTGDTPEYALIAVGTPSSPSGDADTTEVWGAAAALMRRAGGSTILVVKSTVPVGTCDALASELTARCGRRIEVVSNPEFVREGSAYVDFMNPDRIVVGAQDKRVGQAVADLYRGIRAPVYLTTTRTAELAKYAANAMLAARISFINEVAGLADAAGADAFEVAAIVGADRRIGSQFLRPSFGWGGPCLPKDLSALRRLATLSSYPAPLLTAIEESNALRRELIARTLIAATQESSSPAVGVLGLGYKAGAADARESPSAAIIDQLVAAGVNVRVHDPVCDPPMSIASRGVIVCQEPYAVAEGVDALAVASDYPLRANLDWLTIRRLMRGRLILGVPMPDLKPPDCGDVS
jgi:UDPglucose 6-dehydrogenase